jgi:beta-1,4-mannosyl-glycoprotein beta-1,4-N-acetylglucosaminyltransferase
MPVSKKKFKSKTQLNRRKVYDCFMFSNELELLNFRFEYLSPYVDFFVLVESRKTTQGNPKPLFYNDNKSKFKKHIHKIKHLVIDDFPTGTVAFTNESIQRNAMISCLVDCNTHDLILISDLDEIPNLNKIPKKLYDGVVYHFLQDQHIYFANTYKEKHIIWEGGTKVVTYKTIRDNLLDEAFVCYGPTFLKEYNEDTTLTKVRLYRKTKFIYNGGYHLTYFGGVDKIIQKMKTFGHVELIESKKFTKKFIIQNLSNGIDIFDSNQKIYRLPTSKFLGLLREFLPNFFYENCDTQNKFGYHLRRIYEILLISLRSIVRIRWRTLRSIIFKFLKKDL